MAIFGYEIIGVETGFNFAMGSTSDIGVVGRKALLRAKFNDAFGYGGARGDLHLLASGTFDFARTVIQ